MSDLQDLIATNAVRAYNQGLERGVASERERIIELLETWGQEAGCYCCASDVAAADIIAEIKGEQE